MPPIEADAWPAPWIIAPDRTDADPLPLFRRSFTLARLPTRATIRLCGLGQFELRCNGERVSDHLLQPGWTDYRKTGMLVAHDLTPFLRTGENVLAVLLGHGMYHSGNAPAGTKRYTKFKATLGPPTLTALFHVEHSDGATETIPTDNRWQTAPGPITYSNIYGGEDHDARLDPVGWDAPGFDATAWPHAAIHPGPGGAPRDNDAPPVRVAQSFGAALMKAVSPQVAVYDAGQNCSMIPHVVVRGPRGSSVKLYPAESLNDDGTVNQKHTGSPVFYRYTLRGDGYETWSPRFSYTGGRYVQAETEPADSGEHPEIISVTSRHVTAAGEPAGTFACSNELFTKTATLIDWAIRSNFVSTLTDCPTREKLGWLEEQHLMGPSLMYAYDCGPLFRKLCQDHTDAQLPNGDVPTICPQYTVFQPPWDVFNDSPEWGSSSVLVPWQAYRWYGDVDLLRRQWPTMRRYVDYLASRATDHIVSHGLGDWYDLGPNPPGFSQLTPKELTATATYFHDAEVLSKIARALGVAEDAEKYAALASKIRVAFVEKFYDATARTFATGSQTSLAMPLAFGLVPDDDRDAVLANLIADIRSRDNALTSGDVGYRYLLRALAVAGRSDVIFDMNCRDDRPGYGMMLAKGQTALTEAWDARPESSRNHFMLGHLLEWLYADLVGISQADDSVAFQHVVIRPNPVGDITHAAATYESVRGNIAVAWRIENGSFTLDATIPPTATATLHLPGQPPESIGPGEYRRQVASPGKAERG